MFGTSTNNAINNDVHLHNPAPYQWPKRCKICALFGPRVIFFSYSAPLSHVDSIYRQIAQRVKFMKMYARLINTPMLYILKNSTVPEPDPSQSWDLENTTQEAVRCNKESAQKCLGLTLLDWLVFVHNTKLDFPCFATGRRTVES